MKNIIYLLAKYGIHFLFLLLEVFCFYLIITYNKDQNEIFVNSTNIVATKLNTNVDRWQNYLRLEEENDSLQTQNAQLIKRFINADLINLVSEDSIQLESQQYDLISTKICNATFHLKNNYLTLCAGKKHGIEKNMGVITQNGVLGQITSVSEHYSKVMSILHSQSRISAGIKRNNAYGSLKWNGHSPLELSLEAIPKHVDVQLGDTIITSGFSTIFPKGIEIGTISKVEKGNNNYKIKVELFNDPTKWDVTYVVVNHLANEQKELEIEENDRL